MAAMDTVLGANGQEAGWVTRLANRDHTGAEYQELKFTIHRKLLDRINLEALSSLAGERARAEIRIAVAKLVDEERTPLSLAEKERVIEEVLDEVFGLGPLEPLLRDPTISDILVTTPKLVYIERGGKLYRTSVEFKDNTHLLRIIEKVVARVGRRVDESSPLVDARLPDGSRVNAAIPPVAVDGPLLSIRRFGKELLQGEDLVKKLALTDGMLELLKACVRARLNILISGGTGAGKTTLLNVLSSYIPENERIITIEDAAELRLRQTHVARMETRPANIEGNGAIKIRDLVINALRMRPDRIIVGEVRSEEALDMLQAMNTGHDGSLTTITRIRRATPWAPRSPGRHGQREHGRALHPGAGDERHRPDGAGCPLQRRQPQGHLHHRTGRPRRRPGHHAGHFPFREERRGGERKSAGTVQGDRRQAPLL